MKQSKWRQDFEVWRLNCRGSLEQAIVAVEAVAEALASDSEFWGPGRDTEYCLILRTKDRSKVITCGTDSGTNHSAREFGKRLKRKSRFVGVDLSHEKGRVVEWLRHVEEISSHHAMWSEGALRAVTEDARGYGASDDVELCFILRNWYRTRIVTCGVTEAAAKRAWDLGCAIKNSCQDMGTAWNPSRTHDSH